jgi:hypothetical protein
VGLCGKKEGRQREGRPREGRQSVTSGVMACACLVIKVRPRSERVIGREGGIAWSIFFFVH